MADSSGANVDASVATRHAEFLRLYTQACRRIYTFILTILPHSVDAEEVLQETSIILWNKLDEFRPGGDFGSWACGIALRQALQYRRLKLRLPGSLSAELMEQLADERGEMIDELQRRAAAVRECIAQLSDSDRELLRVRYEDARNTRQAARMLQRPANTVYKAISRIRRRLLECTNRKLAQGEH